MICVVLTLVMNRSEEVFQGENHIHFGGGLENFVTLPVIPPKGC